MAVQCLGNKKFMDLLPRIFVSQSNSFRRFCALVKAVLSCWEAAIEDGVAVAAQGIFNAAAAIALPPRRPFKVKN